MGLLSALTRSRLSTLSGARKAAQRGMIADEPVTRLPVNPSRELGANALPMRAPQPFRQSLVGGSEDLMEALRMGKIDWPTFLMLMGVSGAATQKAPPAYADGASG